MPGAIMPSKKDGRVYSRWHHDEGDNMVPGTYDPQTGYYDCGWVICWTRSPIT